MSGISLAVSPPNKAESTSSAAQKTEQKSQINQQQQQQTTMGGVMGSLRVIELQLVAFIMVFSASGLVPLLDLIFPAFASAYLLALSRLVFPAHGIASSGASNELFQGSKFCRLYVIIGTSIGLFLPLAYVLGGFARGDGEAVRSATPHLFLLSFQILTENVIGGLSLFSPPVRALVPLLYTVRRLFLIIDWISNVWSNKPLPANVEVKMYCRFLFILVYSVSVREVTDQCLAVGAGLDMVLVWRILAVSNLVYFSINLFCFLIPKFLPRAFWRYFSEENEIRGKFAEDKSSAAANRSSPTTDNKKSD